MGEHSGDKYRRTVRAADGSGGAVVADVYAVLAAFGVTCPARAHAVKKLLCAGLRGKGDELQDVREARDAVSRAVQMLAGDGDEEPAPRGHTRQSVWCCYCPYEEELPTRDAVRAAAVRHLAECPAHPLRGRVEALERENEALRLLQSVSRLESERLRAAIKAAGFAVMQTSGDWSVHDVSEKGKADDAAALRVATENVCLEVENEKLRAALKPFAEWGRRFGEGWPDSTGIGGFFGRGGKPLDAPTLGDCRRAADLLARPPAAG